MIGQEMGFFVGSKSYDFTAEDGKRLIGATAYVGHKPTSADKNWNGLRLEVYSVSDDVLGVIDDLKPFNEYTFGIELRTGWKKGKIVSVSSK